MQDEHTALLFPLPGADAAFYQDIFQSRARFSSSLAPSRLRSAAEKGRSSSFANAAPYRLCSDKPPHYKVVRDL
jgi:hypothetical protein